VLRGSTDDLWMADLDGDSPLQRRSRRRLYRLAVTLAALAGWVDSIAFSEWSGLYVSFMSGNSTALAAALSSANWPQILQLCGVLFGFVGGVVCGELLAKATGRWDHTLVLLAEALLLGAAMATLVLSGATAMAALLLAVAMGLQNASVHQIGAMSVAVTYVTGTLVHLGRGLSAALRGEGSWTAPLPYLGLWLGLVSGAAAGAVMAHLSAPGAIAIAGAVALWLSATVAPPGRQIQLDEELKS
jgi:uncharacterized membrane protein YoaK (UPF0700 family)